MNDTPSNERYLLLAQKWVNGTITEEELQEYTAWLKEIDPEAVVVIPSDQAASKEAHKQKIFAQINQKITKEKSIARRRTIYKVMQHAALVSGFLALSYLSYQLINQPKPAPEPPIASVIPTDIQPGTNGAILTLANGKVIVLDTASNGALDDRVIKNQDALVFESVAAGNVTQFNTLSTPRARQQQVILPDGSHIWLNAESSIKFPTSFKGNTREIEITGEVYFEIAHNKSMPFIVHAQDASVIVHGTHFNVMAYPNEQFLETTLLEGSVSVKSSKEQKIISPGQQIKLSANDQLQLISNPDLELVMAWKNGVQAFRKTDIKTILRQATRWYDVDVEYEHEIPASITFTGEIPREVTLSQLLKALESKHLHFELDALKKKIQVKYHP